MGLKNLINNSNMFWSHLICWFSYGLAFLIAFFIVKSLNNIVHPIFVALIADIAATIVIFILSTLLENTSLYDPYWSVAPIIIAIYWILTAGGFSVLTIKQFVVFALVCLWGTRLTYNWVMGWNGLNHEDWRYTKYRVETPKFFFMVNFFGLQMMPTLLVFLGCLSLYPALTSLNASFNALDIIGVIVVIAAILVEGLADEQLRDFKKNKKSGELINKGLWAVSRHPNYLGEISFWWGLWFFAIAVNIVSYWWMISGPVSITILFVVVSIPLMENRMKEKYPDYCEYQKKVSRIIPWFPKKDEEK